VIELPTLYTHQGSLRDAVRTAVMRKGRVIMCANPGFGKTRCAKWKLGSYANQPIRDDQSGQALFAVHRRGLVDNAIGSFNEEPALPHGVIMSGRDTDYNRHIQIASIDSLNSWFHKDGKYNTDITFDLLIFDECHSHHSKLATFLAGHDAKREELGLHPAFVIGLTATPEAEGLADIYQEIVTGPTTEWLIENKYLSPFRYFRATQGQLGLLVKHGNEFTNDSVAAAFEGLAGDLVRDWLRYAQGRSTVGFFPRLTHAREAQRMLRGAGVKAEYVDGNTPDEERRSLFTSLNKGYIDYLCNVGVVERGTDIPRIGCVQMCVAVGSVVRYRQMIGRGSRVHPDTDDCLVLDHGGNVKRHGFFEDEVQWTLDRSSKDAGEVGTRPTIECPRCKAIYRGGRCKSCDYEPSARERRSQKLVFDGSELKEVTRKEPTQKKKQTCEQIMIRALYMAGRSGRTWKQAVGMAYGMASKQGTKMRIPKRITVGGQEYNTIPYGSPDGGRRVSALYEFTKVRTHEPATLQQPGFFTR